MSVTANDIFTSAAGLLGLLESNGSLSAAAEALQGSAIPCINTVIQETTGYNKAITGEEISPSSISSLTDAISCDEYISGAVLPAGLARYLALRFDRDLAQYYRAEYVDRLASLRRRYRAVTGDTEEVYS